MPSSPKDNTMLSAQESYFKSHFQATVDKLNPALETEELHWKDELRIKQNISISVFALGALTPISSTDTKERNRKSGISASLLSSLIADFTAAAKNVESGVDRSRENLSPEDAVLSTESTPFVIKSSSIVPETFIILFNIASIKYEHREYNCCREILEKIILFLSREPQDSGVSIKVCFLLLEVLLRQWNDCPACHTAEQLIAFKNQSLQTLAAAEMYISLLYKLYPSSDDNYGDNHHKISVPSSVDFKDLIMNVLKFKVNLFYARIYMSSQLYSNAEKYISTAMMIFSDFIEPVLIASDTEIILTDTQGIQVIIAALSSYLGLISIELPVDRNIVRQTLGELKRKGLNTQSELAYLVNDGAESLRLLNLLSDEPTSDSILFQGKDYQYYSNAASVYMLQGKYHLACLFSQRAVEEVRKKSQVDKNYQNNRDGFGIADGVGGEDIEKDEENSEEIYRSVSPFDKAQSEAVSYSGSLPYRCTAEVLYNAALALLLTGNFLGALSYFEQITKQLGTRPILWIRMAECCIQQYSKQNGVSQSKEGRMLVCEGSTGRGRRLQFRSDLNLGPGSSSQSNLESGTIRSRASAVSDTESGDDSLATSGYNSKINGSAKSSSNSDCKALLMNKAVQYLSNALYLIRDTRKKNETVRSTRNGHNDDNDPSNSNCTSNDNGIGNPKESKDPPQSPVHSPTLNSLSSRTSNQKRLDELECTALSKLAYVHLELDSPLSALAAAKQIASFRSTHISELTRFLALTYMCESLCSLGRVDEAMALLQPQLSDLATSVPLSDSADIHLLTTYSEEVSSPSSSSGSSSSSSSSSSHTRKCVPLLNSTNIPDHLFTNNKHYTPKSRNFCNGDSDHGRDRDKDKDKDKDNVADSEMTDRNSLESLVTSVNFASILILQGAPSRAQSILEGVLRIRPLFIPALKLLAYILLREGKFEEALQLLKLS